MNRDMANDATGRLPRGKVPGHLARDLEKLTRNVLLMGANVEEMIHAAMASLIDRKEDAANSLPNRDDVVDRMDVEIEQDCLKILALHQPVAHDLRYVTTCMKVTMDLERMADQALNIAQIAKFIARRPAIDLSSINFAGMVDRVKIMVKKSLDSLVNWDPNLAREVCASDDAVDKVHEQMYTFVKKVMKDSPESIDVALDTLSASRNLERIADLATNIAEDVVYLVEGQIIRHSYGRTRAMLKKAVPGSSTAP